MKSVGGAGLVVIGMLFLYLAITGKLDCFFNFISCLTSGVIAAPQGTTSTGTSSNGSNFGQEIIDQGGKIIGEIFGGSSDNNVSINSVPTMHL